MQQGYMFQCSECKQWHEAKHDDIDDYKCSKLPKKRRKTWQGKELDKALEVIKKQYKRG